MKSEIITTPERSRLMALVRQEGTSAEIAVRSIVKKLKVDFQTNIKDLPGSPDLVNRANKWAIFVHGCFWHAHENCAKWSLPTRNRKFWEDKFKKNRERDRKKIKLLEEAGFSILVVWECELNDLKAQKKIQDFFSVNESYEFSNSKKSVLRTVYSTNGINHSDRIFLGKVDLIGFDAKSAFDQAYLRKSSHPNYMKHDIVRGVDLFCGCGGLSLGVMEACRAMGKQFLSVAAVDNNSSSLNVYKKNIGCAATFEDDINNLIDGDLGEKITKSERQFLEKILPVRILLAGPPCQGYSDLNNHTRRNDVRNALYQRVTRFIEIAKPNHFLVENVPRVVHGKDGEIDEAIDVMESLGYHVDADIVDLSELCVPQKRKRHVMIGSTSKKLTLEKIIGKYADKRVRNVFWALSDLEEILPKDIYDTPSRHSNENKERIAYLHENNLYDLPDLLRPSCHQDGKHSYKSMYGRMRYDQPAQTITSGFGSPGQGRFIHPNKYRTITPHEATRLQFFPDFFDFTSVKKRTSLAKMIGNAVPMKLSYYITLEYLG